MLDTHTVICAIKRQPQVIQRLLAVPMHSMCISAITAGELAFGLAKRAQALALKVAVQAFNARQSHLRQQRQGFCACGWSRDRGLGQGLALNTSV